LIIDQDSISKAYNKALHFLSFQNRTKCEIVKKLSELDFKETDIESAIKKLELKGYIDDRKYISNWVDSKLRNNPVGKFKAEYELKNKGITQDLLNEELPLIYESIDELELANTILMRKRIKVDIKNEKTKRKAASLLERRGISGSTIIAIIQGNNDF